MKVTIVIELPDSDSFGVRATDIAELVGQYASHLGGKLLSAEGEGGAHYEPRAPKPAPKKLRSIGRVTA